MGIDRCRRLRSLLRYSAPPLITIVALLTAGSAGASTSSNWSGYAIHHPGTRFRSASGSWTIPAADCADGAPAYSATWIGIGGYALSSTALEQTGTETDCDRHGRVISYAWFEIVPAPSRTFRLKVEPGDRMRATVTVVGHDVTLVLRDLSTDHSATKTATAKAVDVSSAEWIVEAPSQCDSPTNCEVLPLADFGSVAFTGARAQKSRGQVGALASGLWRRTRITMADSTHHFVPAGDTEVRRATPSPLSPTGAAFDIAFSTTSIPTYPYPAPYPIEPLPGGPILTGASG
jgi:hypothetical protein